MAQPTARQYIAWLLAATALTITAAATINASVDPYGLFGAPRIAGFNAVKPAAPDRIRFTKTYYAARFSPRTIIAGNSRPELGLDPASPCWPAGDGPVFNAGIPGAGLALQLRYAEHAAADAPVGLVVLGLDLLDFLAPPVADPCDRDVNLRVCADGRENPHYRQDQLRDFSRALFSLSSLQDALRTILTQSRPDQATRDANGFNPARDYQPIIRHEGQAVLFAQKMPEVVQRLRATPGGRPGARPWDAHLAALGAFADRMQASGADLVLFINPYHADYLSAILLTGTWAAFEDWKRTLTAFAESRGLPLWDFNAVDAMTTAAPPPAGRRAGILPWFWEPAHYRAALGDLMLRDMLTPGCTPPIPAPASPVPLGTRLTPATMETHLAGLRQALESHLVRDARARERLARAMGPG